MSPSAWSQWATRTPDQELPSRIGPKASETLQQMYEDAQRFEQTLLTAIAKKPMTREQLTRGSFGRSSLVETTIDRLLGTERLHKGRARLVNSAGIARYLEVLRPGPAPDVAPMSSVEFTERRQLSGLSRPEFARCFGVSATQVGHWETGRQAIPSGRTDELRAVFDELGTADVPHRDLARHTDAELEEAALELLTATPGQTRKALTVQMPGDVRRRHATVMGLLAAGRLVERQERRHRVDGHAFAAAFLYVAPRS